MGPVNRRAVVAALGLAPPALGWISARAADAADPVLADVIANGPRAPADKARDVYRHPATSLAFWGLRPGMTVIDVQPGTGWWTDILAPYLARTHGRYIAAGADLSDPKLSDGARKSRAAFEAKYESDAKLYGQVSVVGFGQHSGPLGPPGSADMVLVSREMHDWAQVPGYMEKGLADIHAVLKRRGILAVEDHRAAPGADPHKGDGYLPESYVIDTARKAGFTLAGRSEINANPKDDRDHPFGVWTLPPTRRSAPAGQPPNPSFDHAKYDAIGESDRMTLKFVKAGR